LNESDLIDDLQRQGLVKLQHDEEGNETIEITSG
jgi:hypothetical protein